VSDAGALAHRDWLGAASNFWLSAEILVAYARARRALRRQGLPAAAAAMRRASDQGRRARDDAYRSGLRLGRAVTRVVGFLQRDPRCLTTSLVLTALLARRGIPATLVIGVRADPFAAHAWVEHRGRPLLPPATAPFERLVEV
jgi:transglutaminase-like putative cysteine protease